MTDIPPPRLEGTVPLPDGRRLGFAAFGASSGPAILWFHGTPGARRQVPPAARRLAAERGLRIIGVDRPGIGLSTSHRHDDVAGFADDVAALGDALGIDRFGLVGLSGGGPYVLACASRLPDRVVAGCVLGGVAPSAGEEAVPGGAIALARSLGPAIHLLQAPVGDVVARLVGVMTPRAAGVGFDVFVRTMPPGDRAVMTRPEMRHMFLDDLLTAGRQGFHAALHDLVLFGRPWGFSLRDVTVPIHFWHGDDDALVPLDHGRHQADLVPGSTLRVRPTEGHMGGLDAVDEILAALDAGFAARAG